MRISQQCFRRVPALVVAAAVLVGCAGASSKPGLSQYEGNALSFDYPGSWSAATFDVQSSFSNVLVYLSTAPMSDPCDRAAGSISCTRLAVTALGPDGILVDWSRNGFPDWTFDPSKGKPMTVDRRRATIEQYSDSHDCLGIGGGRELIVTIEDPVPRNWTMAWACLKGPSLDTLQGQFDAMLSTVKWKQ